METTINILEELTAPTDKDLSGQPEEVTTETAATPEETKPTAPTEREPEQKVFTTVKAEASAMVTLVSTLHTVLMDALLSKNGKYDLTRFKASASTKQELTQSLSDILNARGEKMNPYIIFIGSVITAFGINSFMAWQWTKQQDQREKQSKIIDNTPDEFSELLKKLESDEKIEPEEIKPEPTPKAPAKKVGRKSKKIGAKK